MKIVTTVVFLMMLGLAWGQTPSFYYEVEYVESEIQMDTGDTLFNMYCTADLDAEPSKTVNEIHLEVGTMENTFDLVDVMELLDDEMNVELLENNTKAKIYFGKYPLVHLYYRVTLHYTDGTSSSPELKTILRD